jgi:hypothetical protein
LSSQAVVEVIDNILEPTNEAGWQAFEEVCEEKELCLCLYRTQYFNGSQYTLSILTLLCPPA